jgi:hypothetical protein
MTENQPIQPDQPRSIKVVPNPSNAFFRKWEEILESVASTEQFLRHPEGRTAATDRGEDDEYSDENLRMWEEEDKLDPELAEWLKAQLGE